MTPPRILYAIDCQELERLLAGTDRHGGFCTHDQCYAAMPVLEVEDVGKISFPVPDMQVKSLIGVAGRAPYGKGSETLVDESVRKCWQIDASCLQLDGWGWRGSFDHILESVTEGLGCPAGSLEASLYKLLIYEPGGFFAPHRDTEKVDGMVATLTVSLPTTSLGAGGRLLVRHAGQEISVEMVASEPSEVVYAAFYADCVHEIEKLESGYRLALVFNLCLHSDAKGAPRTAPDNSGYPEQVAHELTKWQNSNGRESKLVWVMEHDYTMAGLSFDTLKNADDAVARVLVEAAKLADFELFAALVSITEVGDGGWDDEYYDVEFEFDEIYEWNHSLDEWISPQDHVPDFGSIPMSDYEMLPTGVLNDAIPYDQWRNEPTGNEGVSIERIYHRAAFVMWPRLESPAVLSVKSIDAALTWVMQQWRDGDKQTHDHVQALIDVWSELPAWKQSGESRASMCQLLAWLGDPALAKRFLQDVVVNNYDGDEDPGMIKILGWLEADFLAGFLAELAENFMDDYPAEIVSLLVLTGRLPEVEWKQAITRAAKYTLSVLPKLLTPEQSFSRYRWKDDTESRPFGAQGFSDVIYVAESCGLDQELATTVFAMADQNIPEFAERRIPETLMHVQDMGTLNVNDILVLLWQLTTDALVGRSSSQPETPDNWIIDSPKSCDCYLCKKLQAFCQDPVETVLRIPVRQDLRRHLHLEIDSNRLSVSHKTERRGRPFTLVCTKNRSGFHRRLDVYRTDVSHMEFLVKMADNTIDDPDRIEQLHTAIANSKG